jgi:glycerate dehydrogenase
MKIVILDGFSVNPGDLSWSGLEKYGEMDIFERTLASEVVPRSKDAEVVLTNKVVLSKDVLAELPHLRYVGVLATGYNVVDLQAASDLGIVVTNIPAYSTDSVAQMVFAHLLNITNGVAHYANENAMGRWSNNPDFCYWDAPIHSLSGMQMGIVGLGHIGSAVARIALAFGMHVHAFTSKNTLPDGVVRTRIDDLFRTSDVLTLHCPLTPTTREMVCARSLKMMKPGAILINTGRGPLINEADVAEALNSGHLAAFGADVLSTEPPSPDNPLLKVRNAFITPHIAWATVEARQRLMRICQDNVAAYVDGHPQNVVNP